MITIRLLVLCAASASFFASLRLEAQDDSYAPVRFTNDSDQPVQLKVWNPRVSRASFEATVENGKSTDLPDKEGKPSSIGINSSRIQVNALEPKSLSSVATYQDGVYVVVWTKDGFKSRTKE